MKRTLARRTLGLSLAVFIVALTGFYASRQFEAQRGDKLLRQRMADLNRDIDRDLPPGSEGSDVIKFLDVHSIDHSPIMPDFIEKRAAFTIDAQTRDKVNTAHYPCSIHIDFFFNETQRMTSYSDHFSCYGP